MKCVFLVVHFEFCTGAFLSNVSETNGTKLYFTNLLAIVGFP